MKVYLLCILISFFSVTSVDMSRCRNNQFECKNGNCIRKSSWCGTDTYGSQCGDKSDRVNCNTYHPNCAKNQTYCKTDAKCIPFEWECDGYVDCKDNSDEQSCWKWENILNVRQSKRRGIQWLIRQRRPDWGWGKDTTRVIVTLRFLDYFSFTSEDIKSRIMFKQLKLQISDHLLENDLTKFKEYEIASYIHSLLAICSDPRNFQGFDLVKLLKDKIENSEWINPTVALAICNANHILLPRQIEKLEEIALTSKNSPHWIETRAYALMALVCLINRTKLHQEHSTTKVISDHNSTVLDFSRIKEELTKLQKEDGSFGNLYTTAILIHALLSMEVNVSSGNEWNIKKAINYLISQQKADGSFGDNWATYLILPILNGKTFVNLGDLNCSMIQPVNQTIQEIQEELDSRNVKKHRVKYFIFVGQDKDIIFNLLLNVPINSTFYDVMHLASKLDDKFRFNYVDYPWGKYIYSIFGFVNDAEKRNYWQLYNGTDNSTTYLQQSPDNIIPKNYETYIYWFKHIDN